MDYHFWAGSFERKDPIPKGSMPATSTTRVFPLLLLLPPGETSETRLTHSLSILNAHRMRIDSQYVRRVDPVGDTGGIDRNRNR